MTVIGLTIRAFASRAPEEEIPTLGFNFTGDPRTAADEPEVAGSLITQLSNDIVDGEWIPEWPSLDVRPYPDFYL